MINEVIATLEACFSKFISLIKRVANFKILFIGIIIFITFSNNTIAEKSAEQWFYESVNAYRIADEKSRKLGRGNIDKKSFEMVIDNLDKSIPELQGIMLGRALVIKASCYYWLYLEKSFKSGPKLYDPARPPDPLKQQGLSFALQGRKILEELGSSGDLPWANDIVQKLGGN
jgi:hypothetical protein